MPDPDEGWVLVAERSGVTLSALGLEGTDLPRIRGEGLIEADPLLVLAVFADVSRSADWMPNLIEARYLAPPTNSDSWVYQRGRAPIPANLLVWDRDVVVHNELIVIEPGRAWRTNFSAGDPERVSIPHQTVRILHMQGHALLRRTDEGHTQFTFEVEFDAGGGLPDTIKAYATQELPIKMVRAVRDRVANAGEEYAHLIARWREDGVDLSLVR